MKYCEIVIGPPGSGKSTYVDKKIDYIKHRNPYVINLDPGNIYSDHYDYSITEKYTVGEYQKEHGKGPNASTKDILNDFVGDLNQFYYDRLEDNECYLLIDLPGQVEFLVNGNSLQSLIRLFSSKGYSVVVICLVDLVFFNHSPLSSYLFTYICVSLLEVPSICVISKCDNYHKIDFKYDLEKISKLEILLDTENESFDGFKNLQSKAFMKSIIEFLSNNPLFNYEILDYENKDTVRILQLIIDRCSGYVYDEEFQEEEEYPNISIDSIFDKYKKI
ncbi:GPN-loop GTPase 2 [Nosema granulosis]|uniref:GPN-loop GTPase 3 n=1 Tax=Nosema granulosis TaxID=83296 RepID=A0A9P6L0V9_9MICR|nr:GPN-loop GTPase 2 [Nosema granulosis]